MRAQYNELDKPALEEEFQPLLGRTLVLVAHPDDETIACGGLMQFMQDPHVLFLTDGAPADEYWWKKYGSRRAYARLRQQEARAALREVGVENCWFLGDHEIEEHEFADQNLYKVLERAFEETVRLAAAVRPDALLTLAYEGGHPDHDSAAFLGARVGEHLGAPTFEAPLYHRTEERPYFQEWTCPAGKEFEFAVEGDVLARKKAMLTQYRSQFTTLSEGFRPAVEKFRAQPTYDFSRPPHSGRLNYEAWGWNIHATDVCRAFTQFDSRNARKG